MIKDFEWRGLQGVRTGHNGHARRYISSGTIVENHQMRQAGWCTIFCPSRQPNA
jgi:hypothetical protein